MSTRLRTYVDTLFEDAPTTTRVYDFKEELLANLEEKYEDLLASGYGETDAYTHVIAGMGDTDALIASLCIEPEYEDPTGESGRGRTAQIVATSAFLYCIAIAGFLLLRMVFGSTIAWIGFWVIAGFATAQTVYHYMTRPTSSRSSRSPFSGMSPKRRKQVRGSISSILWLVTTALYFIMSFKVGNWHISWIIFILAAIVEQVLHLLFKMGDE